MACNALQKYLKKNHNDFYKHVEDLCAQGLFSGGFKNYPRGAIIPSKDVMGELSKLAKTEEGDEARVAIIKSYALMTCFTPLELKKTGNFLVNRNHKRIAVASVGADAVKLDNGTSLSHDKKFKDKNSIVYVASGPLSEGSESEKKDLTTGGAIFGFGSDARDELLDMAVKGSSSDHLHMVANILRFAAASDDMALYDRVSSMLSYCPFVDLHIILGVPEIMSNSGSFKQVMNDLKSEKSDKEIYTQAVSRCPGISKARRSVITDICRSGAHGDFFSLIENAQKAYKELCQNNTVVGTAIFPKGAAELNKKINKAFVDEFRFCWSTNLQNGMDLSQASVCMRADLKSKRCTLLSKTDVCQRHFWALRTFIQSDMFLFAPMSPRDVRESKATNHFEASDEDCGKPKFLSVLKCSLASFDKVAGGGMAIDPEKINNFFNEL